MQLSFLLPELQFVQSIGFAPVECAVLPQAAHLFFLLPTLQLVHSCAVTPRDVMRLLHIVQICFFVQLHTEHSFAGVGIGVTSLFVK